MIKKDACSQKVCFFLPSLEGGGAQKVMVHLANGFSNKGFEVDLVLVTAEGPYLKLLQNKVNIIDLKSDGVIAGLPKLIRYLKSEKPMSVLSTQEHSNIVAILACLFARNKSKVFVRLVNFPIQNSYFHQYPPSKKLQSYLVPRLARFLYPFANGIIAPSGELAQEYIDIYRLPREKVLTVYNPAITSELLAKCNEPLDHPWFGSDQPPVILGVGRLTLQKDFTTLLRAFQKARNVQPIRLIILGEGEERPKLEALAQDLNIAADVDFPGFVDNPYCYMKRSSLFVLSSLWEGMPNVLLEAMACGIPVVATDCKTGPKEILESGKWGELVPVGDIGTLANSILVSLNGFTKTPSKDYMESRFGINSILDQYIRILTN